MNDADRKAFEEALLNRCKTIVTVPQDFDAGWQAACEWRDSQMGEPVATAEVLTIGDRKQVRYPFDAQTFKLSDGVHRLYAAPPAAQINQQLVQALENLLESALKYKLEPSDLCVEDAQAALAAATQMRGDA